ncbi:MAG: SBBP repeat-containing protein [Saprospiraceae bacterium]
MSSLNITRSAVLTGLFLLLSSSWFCASIQGQITRQYSSYYGGSGWDDIFGASVNNEGTTFYVGTSDSPNLGTTASALQRYHQGGKDAFVSAVDKDGVLLWSTYLGSAGEEEDMWAIAATPDDRFLYVAFSSSAASLPFVSPTGEQPANGGNKDVVLVKLRKNGTLMWGTFLGGSGNDLPYRISVTQSGGVLVTGETASSNFPTDNALQNTLVGTSDGFIAKYADHGELLMSTFLGGSGDEQVYDASETNEGGIIVVGHTETPFLNSPKRPYSGAGDLFVVSMTPTYSYAYRTYLGGSDAEAGTEWPGIEVDKAGNAYIVGRTSSSNYPTLQAIQTTKGGGTDGVVSCLSSTGDLTWSTYFGGTGDDEFTAIDMQNDLLFIGGSTYSSSMPQITAASAFQQTNGGSGDGFFTAMRTDGTVAYASFYGGNGIDEIHDITILNGFLSFAGHSAGTNFPVVNAVQISNGGSFDGQLVMFKTDPFSAALSGQADASDCDTDDGQITIQLSAAELGTPPYDVSIDNGTTWPSGRTDLTANASNQVILSDIPWGTYVLKIRDALGTQSNVGQVQIKGCEMFICMQSGENRLQIPEVIGATSYTWTTTLGTIQSGQGTRTIFLNTTGIATATTGEVCVQPEGPGCAAPAVCVDVQTMCDREYCNNGIDDDGDSLIDCEDGECPGANAVVRINAN